LLTRHLAIDNPGWLVFLKHIQVTTFVKWNNTMNLHEYQGKQLFAQYGLPVSKGIAAATVEEAVAAADQIGGDMFVVKAQVHAGGRGKAGGVKLVKSKEEIAAFADKWLGKNLVTYQTDEKGQPVSRILVESCTDIAKELYLGAVVDRSSRRIVFMASTEGGVEIEKVAHDTPEKILKVAVDPLVGAQPYQGRDLAFKLGLEGKQINQFVNIFLGLAKLFKEKDLAGSEPTGNHSRRQLALPGCQAGYRW
jgi:succinyl-CoA synthetase beta subunit